MNVSSTLLTLTAAVLLCGCGSVEKYIDEMTLEQDSAPQIKNIVEKHKAEINRKQELDLLCNKAWVPVYINGQEGEDAKNAIALPKDVQAYIEFKQDGQFSGFSGVSFFSGAFAVSAPDKLRLGSIAATLKAGAHLDYEMLFMAQLSDVDNFAVQKNGELVFRKRNALMIRFKPVDPKTVKRPAAAVKSKKAAQSNTAADNAAMPTVDAKNSK